MITSQGRSLVRNMLGAVAAALVLAVAGLPIAAQAQADYRDFKSDGDGKWKHDRVGEIVDYIRTMYARRDYVEGLVRAKAPFMREEQVPLYTDHLMAILGNEQVLQRVRGAVDAALLADFTNDQMTAYFLQVGMGLQGKGMMRLSDDDIGMMLDISSDVLRWVPADICKRAINSELTAAQQQMLELRWMSTLGIDATRNVLALYKRSILAEAGNYPAPRTLTKEQLDLATRAVGRAALRRWQAMPDPGAGQRSMANTKAAVPEELCSSAQEYLNAFKDLGDPLRGWALTNFAATLAR